jgi:hypothetical protein
MKLKVVFWILPLILSVAMAMPAAAQVSGAIFTTVADGTEVNFNIYPSKDAVYLDGGPGNGAPQTAASLPDGIYVFMVTDPSGKTLLSTDAAQCRQFTVSGGIIVDVIPAGSCKHITGNDVDHPPAITVQLLPFNDTPNPGGEYKAWATPLANFPASCLNKIDCTVKGTKHGFTPKYSKTDNFKVGPVVPTEIDTRFFDGSGQILDGRMITWIDTLGASNVKWSYYDPTHYVNHEAHVEAPEAGVHEIVIDNQPGCTVGQVYLAGKLLKNSGPQSVAVRLSLTDAVSDLTIFIDVMCQ